MCLCPPCRNLASKDSNGLSDPFAVVTVGTATEKTTAQKDSLNPEWNQVFICVYVCMCVCVCSYVCMFICAYVCMCVVYVCVCVRVRERVCV
jgi:hypothetical protein